MLQQSLTGPWQFRQAQTEAWWPAQVPGGVHTDLLALERIPDPFVAVLIMKMTSELWPRKRPS
jgi:beta-mannosidase